MKKLIQITPALPPEVNGLGDYAYKLAENLLKHHIQTTFICTGKGDNNNLNSHFIKPNKNDRCS